MADTLREPRTMILAALPFPPLPISVHKIEKDSMTLEEDTENSVTTTHSLFALCINECVRRNDQKFNEERQKKQMRVLEEFMYGLKAIGCTLKDEQLYHFYCDYSYRHLCTYFKDDDKPQIRFKPYDYVSVGDETHAKMVEHYIAQGIIFEEEELDKKARQTISKYEVGKLLELFRGRLAKIKE